MSRLWEHDHPYYCSEGNYFSNGYHNKFESWQEFVDDGDALYNGDEDMNLLFRWDWKKADPDNYRLAPGDPDDESEEFAEAQKHDQLLLFYMLQRKAICLSVEVVVDEADEQAVRAWLEKRARHMIRLWEPLLDEGAAA